jgi:alkylation response protein AidB-like acyl-CoA dehydrogenase
MVKSHRVPLEGEELEQHLAAQAAAQAQQAEQEAQQAAQQQQQQQQADDQQQQQMLLDGPAAAAGAGGDVGGITSPRSAAAVAAAEEAPGSASVPRVNSRAIGHLQSRRSSRGGGRSSDAGAAAAGEVGEVVGPDGLPVEDKMEGVTAAACLIEGFEVPRVSKGDEWNTWQGPGCQTAVPAGQCCCCVCCCCC